MRSSAATLAIGLCLVVFGVFSIQHAGFQSEPRVHSFQDTAEAGQSNLTGGAILDQQVQPTPYLEGIHSGQTVQTSFVSHAAPLVAHATLGLADQTVRLDAIEEVREEKTYRWTTNNLPPVIRVLQRQIKLMFPAGTTPRIMIRANSGTFINEAGEPVAQSAAPQSVKDNGASPSFFSQTLPGDGKQSLEVLQVLGVNTTTTIATLTFDVQLANESTGPATPQVQGVFSNPYEPNEPLSVPSPVKVFGNYIRVRGKFETPSRLGDIYYQAFRKEVGAAKVFLYAGDVTPSVPSPLSDGTWTHEVRIPSTLNLLSFDANGRLFPYAVSSGGTRFSTPVDFTITRNLPIDGTPVITSESIRKVNVRTFTISGTTGNLVTTEMRPHTRVVLFLRQGASLTPVSKIAATIDESDAWSQIVTVPADGDYEYVAVIAHGSLQSQPSVPVRVSVGRTAPSVISHDPTNGIVGEGRVRTKLYFDRASPLETSSAVTKTNYKINGPSAPGNETSTAPIEDPVFDPNDNSVQLTFSDFQQDGTYTVFVNKHASTPTNPIKDVFGNVMKEAKEVKLFRSKLANETPLRPGITSTGEYVAYPEFTTPRKVPDGFNPHDKVETRVSRLYFYRDAHRVAQIINRKVKSYNSQGVSIARQLADKSRNEADQLTENRKDAERAAIAKAQENRRRENELEAAQKSLDRSVQELTAARRSGVAVDDPVIQSLQANVQAFQAKVNTLAASIEQMRDAEVQANSLVQKLEGQERLAREDQFRREVAAAQADPDTYAPGVKESSDPVEQVSVSVIGEGLIHLRGPLKGINAIRMMIDQIDSPVGQVRVSVHTVQINGERGDRMEVVANDVQRSIDHARFLTLQSAEMLRRSVVQVASRRAEAARLQAPGDMQGDRDHRYLYDFFGRDFVDELESMDSEFLKTGNKLLSLHSMDVTSLASALNILALADNSTRREILGEFEGMMHGELPAAEHRYYEAGIGCPGRHCRRRDCKCKQKGFCLLAQNAQFENLKGFFNAELQGIDTISPLQREFIRLAQIFKSRLITELEYKQRVMERAVIEDRLGDYRQELEAARDRERVAEEALQTAASKQRQQATLVRTEFSQMFAALNNSLQKMSESQTTVASFKKLAREIRQQQDHGNVEHDNLKINYTLAKGGGDLTFQVLDESGKALSDAESEEKLAEFYSGAYHALLNIFDQELSRYRYTKHNEEFRRAKDIVSELKMLKGPASAISEQVAKAQMKLNPGRLKLVQLLELEEVLIQAVTNGVAEFKGQAEQLLVQLGRHDSDPDQLFMAWSNLRKKVEESFWVKVPSNEQARLERVHGQFVEFLNASYSVDSAKHQAELARRPLDHKKFLDMLIDDIEEKYIELLEGTRAHTANIDNYLKRLTTALDDDFNTQFYFPTFREVREASQYYDVQFGQTETTSVLANNRMFAKVSPAASMEFDLPKRDILISEAMNGAKAMIDDVGALANDPTFLALAKMKSGSPTANVAPGSTGGQSVVRSVVPGLQSSTSEEIISQNANGGQQFGSNLENLIPDPAIYKFETGTGYEIRPVIQPDGQAVVFDFHYLYSTKIHEPVRADEKHLGRVKQHYIDTDVQLSNFELREVSRYTVALKAARTAKGVPLLEDAPFVGALFRPLPSDESSLQQNLILAQATIFPTLFDLMGLRWAPAVADFDPLRLSNDEFVVRGRSRMLKNRVYDFSSQQVDEFLRIPEPNRRADLYRSQESVPNQHPNGYQGPGLDLRDSSLREGYSPESGRSSPPAIPNESKDGSPYRPKIQKLPRVGTPEPVRIDNTPYSFDRQSNSGPPLNGIERFEVLPPSPPRP